MSNFIPKKKKNPYISLLVSVALLAAVVLIFSYALNTLSKRNVFEQKNSLESFMRRSIVECYSVEGAYPPSLSHLEENYSLRYNKNYFFVDYQPIGENIMPEFTIIIKEEAK